MPPTEWWPEITIDVLQSDLRKFFSQGLSPPKKRTPVTTNMAGEETVQSKWVLRDLEDISASPEDKWEKIESKITVISHRVDEMRFILCSSTFDALVGVVALGKELDFAGGRHVSPLSFCDLDSPIPVTCTNSNHMRLIDISKKVVEHVEIFNQGSTTGQDMKDIQRDTLLLNGLLLKGSEMGYKGICDAIGTSNSQMILSLANRTFSGGIAFENVLTIFGTQYEHVSPLSSEADPLDVIVSGDVAIIRAHTKFSLANTIDGPEGGIVDANVYIQLRTVGAQPEVIGYLFLSLAAD